MDSRKKSFFSKKLMKANVSKIWMTPSLFGFHFAIYLVTMTENDFSQVSVHLL